MYSSAETSTENKTQATAGSLSGHSAKEKSGSGLEDNRPLAILQRKQADGLADKQVKQMPVQKKANNTGLPDNLKSGIENLSGHSMDDVKVHYNSSQPAQLNAHAYAQGTDIHIASGQEKHLPHEAWHVVQQKQGRVKPTMQMKGKVNINDDEGLEKEADVMGAQALQAKPIGQKGINPGGISTGFLTTQLFKNKKTGEHIAQIPPIDEMTDQDVIEVRNAMDRGEIEAESPEELDLFLGRAYGALYDGFPSIEEFEAAEKIPFKPQQEEKGSQVRISHNDGSIFTMNVSGKIYFVKKMEKARGAATETIVPFLAMRLGLVENAAPTVWYQSAEGDYAVTPMMKGDTAKKDEHVAATETSNERLLELFLFDYLVGSYDRIPENVFIDSSGQAKLIDNEGSLGVSGHGNVVGNDVGFKRIGYKSAFLAAFMLRIGVSENIFNPLGAKRIPPKLGDVPIPEALLFKIVNIGGEIMALLRMMEIPTGNILAALKHLKALSESGKSVTVKNILNPTVR